MNMVETLFRFLQYTTELPTQYWSVLKDNAQGITPDNLDEFEKAHCFLPQIQPMMSADSILLILKNLRPARLYSSRDLLGICTMAFVFEGAPFIVGPYVNEEWQDDKANQTLAGLGLPASYLIPYKLYYCSYRLIDEQTVTRLITGAITALKPDYPPYLPQNLSGLKGRGTHSLFEQEPLDFDMVLRRYEQENKFLKLIETGHPQAALEAYGQMGKMGTDKVFSAENLRAMIANATIVRTLARKAAERGGVHPAIVDSISVTYAQKMYAVSNVKEFHTLLPRMIEEFAEAVRKAGQERYSPAINKVVSYISLHLSQEMTRPGLAKLIHVTPSHLSHQFKSETGLTISQYIARKRCEKAAELLLGTSLDIQDISTYAGYPDNNYFTKVFKELYHMTPSAYRLKFGHTP